MGNDHLMTFTLCWGHMCNSTSGHCVQLPQKYIKACGYSDHFSKTYENFNQKVNDLLMTFNPTSVEVTCATLPNGHCVQLP